MIFFYIEEFKKLYEKIKEKLEFPYNPFIKAMLIDDVKQLESIATDDEQKMKLNNIKEEVSNLLTFDERKIQDVKSSTFTTMKFSDKFSSGLSSIRPSCELVLFLLFLIFIIFFILIFFV